MRLDVPPGEGTRTARWLEIRKARWGAPEPLTPENGRLRLQTPAPEGYWAVLVR